MRAYFLSLFVSACILCGLGIGSAITGCGSPTAQRASVNSLFSLGATVDAAYKSYLTLVIQGVIKTNDVPNISKQYALFQAAFGEAVTVSTLSSNAPPSPELANTASQLQLAISAAKGK